MSDFALAALRSFAPSFLQFAIGLALAACLVCWPAARRAASRLAEAVAASPRAAAAAVLAAALAGSAVPLGPAGAVPVAAAALALGLGPELAVPFLLANILFNMLAPSADPTFVWKTGYVRVVFALAAGGIGGLLALRFRKSSVLWFRSGGLCALIKPEGAGVVRLVRLVLRCLAIGAAYLAAGALLDLAFRRYALGAIMGFAYSSPAVSFIPDFLATRNVVNPFFLQTMRLAALLTDFGAYAVLALILRPRGFLRYIAYFAAWAILLGLSAFMKV
jgi:uncharacterized membrane protein YraQ (UPF0718 family)